MAQLVRDCEGWAQWIQAARKERGWTLRELARRSGMSHASVSNVLNCKRNPGPEMTRSLAEGLGLSVAEAFRRVGFIPGPVNEPPSFNEILQIMRELLPDERVQVLEYARWRLREQDTPSPDN